jgi:uncharacterized protein
MSIKQLFLLVGLSLLFAGCASNHQSSPMLTGKGNNSTTAMGVSYLLGRGVPQSNEKAFYYFSQAANSGDPFAENELAYLYAAGKGTAQDYSKAFYWYQQAANQGLASAQYNLGLMYWYGLGVQAKRETAKEWLQKSAAKGFEPARTMLAQS